MTVWFSVVRTMYGTTHQGVTRAREALSMVFPGVPRAFRGPGVGHGESDPRRHSAGYDAGRRSGEVYLVGGLYNAGPKWLEAAVECKISMVLVPMADNYCVLLPMDELLDKFKNGRTRIIANPTMTTMRTNVEEKLQNRREFMVRSRRGPEVCKGAYSQGRTVLHRPAGEIWPAGGQ